MSDGGYEGPKRALYYFPRLRGEHSAMHAMSRFSSRIRNDTVIFVAGVGYVHGACQS